MNRLYLYTKGARLSEVFLVQNEQTLSLCKRGKAVCLILSVQMYKTVHTSYMHTKSFNVGNWSVGFSPRSTITLPTYIQYVQEVYLYEMYFCTMLPGSSSCCFGGLAPSLQLPPGQKPDNLVLCQLLNFHNIT